MSGFFYDELLAIFSGIPVLIHKGLLIPLIHAYKV